MQRKIRHQRIRAKVKGTSIRPRLSVFRSNSHIFAQVINDQVSKTLISASDLKIKKTSIKSDQPLTAKTLKAFVVGQEIGKQALALGIKKVVFDRGGYKYHGRIKAVADGARAAGLEF